MNIQRKYSQIRYWNIRNSNLMIFLNISRKKKKKIKNLYIILHESYFNLTSTIDRVLKIQ